jgi:ApbE superfamily uncharacterized protein (UPF0280 family)
MTGAQIGMLPDGRRLHLNHGPIDLIVEAFGPPQEIVDAYRQAAARFPDLLPTLVEELAMLRRPVAEPRWQPRGPVAGRMVAACWPHRAVFITPMAAVAGAVADEMLAMLCAGRALEKAYVNNGGDIAFYLSPGASLTAGLVADYRLPQIDATCALTSGQPARGIATSGWQGRSFSLGIADSVTILADSGAAADAAATLVANAVNLDHPAVKRVKARDIDPDSDLGDRLVTAEVGTLDDQAIEAALDAGQEVAKELARAGLIRAAVMVLRQRFRIAGTMPAGLLAPRAA